LRSGTATGVAVDADCEADLALIVADILVALP
jgi:hypothetical protein